MGGDADFQSSLEFGRMPKNKFSANQCLLNRTTAGDALMISSDTGDIFYFSVKDADIHDDAWKS